MKVEKVVLSQITESEDNPREISDGKLSQLVESILVFPKMLELRPIVVDEQQNAIGGNMRTRALNRIKAMGEENTISRLMSLDDYKEKDDAGKLANENWWKDWFKSPYAYIVRADMLSADERKEFIIKDNVAFGQFNFAKLATFAPKVKMSRWGMDIFKPTPMDFGNSFGGGNTGENPGATVPKADIDESQFGGDVLPPELQGVDLVPDDLPKFQGDDETATQRVIICYTEADKDFLAALLGLASIDKVVYDVNELKQADSE